MTNTAANNKSKLSNKENMNDNTSKTTSLAQARQAKKLPQNQQNSNFCPSATTEDNSDRKHMVNIIDETQTNSKYADSNMKQDNNSHSLVST